MPPFAAACPWPEQTDSVQNDETRLQETQVALVLADWLARGEAYVSRTRGAADSEAAVILKVLLARPESDNDLLHRAPFETLLSCRLT